MNSLQFASPNTLHPFYKHEAYKHLEPVIYFSNNLLSRLRQITKIDKSAYID